MRPILIALLMLTTSPAFAACESVRDPDWGRETAAQAQQALCLQLELNRRAVETQRLTQLEADYRLKLHLLELEQRLQQQTAAMQQMQLPSSPPIVPAF